MLENTTSKDSTLVCFVLLARHFHVDLTIPGLVHKYAITGDVIEDRQLLEIANDSGFKSKVLKFTWKDLFGVGEAFPLLLRTRENKTLILSGVRGEGEKAQAAIIDPTSGKAGFIFLNQAELENVWDGRVLLFKRVYDIRDENQPFSLRWFFPELLKHKRIFRDIAIATIVCSFMKLSFPIYMQLVMDKVLAHHGLSTLNVLTLAIIIVYVFDGILEHLKDYMLTFATNKVDLKLAKRTFNHLVGLPIGFFDHSSAGVLLKNLQQTEKIREFLTGKLLKTLLDCATLFIFIPILFFYSWILAVIILSFSLAIALSIAFVIKPFKAKLNYLYEEDGKKQSHLVETIRGIHTVKSLSLEPLQKKKWNIQSAKTISTSFSVKNLSISVSGFVHFLENVMLITVIFSGVHLALDNVISVGSLIAVNIISRKVSGPLIKLVSLIHEYQEIGLSVEMLGGILNKRPERPSSARGLIRPLLGNIGFQDVTFSYQPNLPPALKKVSLNITQSSVVGIVGRSGSGKSTLTRLIQGLYPLQEGVIQVDGVDIREIELAHLRRSIGVVLQENFIFSGTVKENISLTKPHATFEEIIYASQLAGADEFIQKLPNGYDTFLNENGANLSGGQKQRLAIARALINQPRILIFDEATSALDAESESIIQDNLSKIAVGRTLIIISHRLSMLLFATKIIVMDNGEIIGDGTHSELVENCEVYRDLWLRQNRHFYEKESTNPARKTV